MQLCIRGPSNNVNHDPNYNEENPIEKQQHILWVHSTEWSAKNVEKTTPPDDIQEMKVLLHELLNAYCQAVRPKFQGSKCEAKAHQVNTNKRVRDGESDHWPKNRQSTENHQQQAGKTP